MRYEFRGPHRPRSVSPEAVGRLFTDIQEREGGIRPVAVLEEARSVESPIHNEFEWDDSVAAEEHRLEQARRLIRAIVIVPEPEKREDMPVIRAFVSLTDAAGERPTDRVYRATLTLTPDERQAAISRLRRELLNLRARYEDMIAADEQLSGAFAVLESVTR